MGFVFINDGDRLPDDQILVKDEILKANFPDRNIRPLTGRPMNGVLHVFWANLSSPTGKDEKQYPVHIDSNGQVTEKHITESTGRISRMTLELNGQTYPVYFDADYFVTEWVSTPRWINWRAVIPAKDLLPTGSGRKSGSSTRRAH